jgi:RNA polymerase-binding protein DksA
MTAVQTVVDLIFVKRLRSRESKLESDNSGKTPLMSIDEFSEFCALLQAASGEGLGFANQSKITDDDALADSAASMDVALVIRESRELQDIEAALARIADGSYGVCIDCGEEIGRARLKAYPTARRCLPCQQQDERPGARASTARS